MNTLCLRDIAFLHTVQISDPVCYWRFDEASGIRYDQLGNLNLNEYDVVSRTTGICNYGIYLSSSVSNLYQTDGTYTIIKSGFTFVVCIYPVPNVSVFLFKAGGAFADYVAYVGGANLTIGFDVYNTNGVATFFSSPNNAVSYNTWNFVYGGYDGASLFISCTNMTGSSLIPRTTQAMNGTPRTGSNVFSVGAYPYGSDTGMYGGKIDELGLWDRALSNAELQEIYNRIKSGQSIR